jgi:predicted aldo/keto reductase-like oxidoreductase
MEIDTIKLQEMVDYAILHGINYFDTAYGYHAGKSEICIGEALSRHPRTNFKLATKMPLVSIKAETDIERIFNDQLKKCKVEYFDFYLIHNINRTDWNNIENYGVYDFLQARKGQGFIRHLGFSFHDNPELLSETIRKYEWDFAQIQLNYMDWDVQNAKQQYQILKDRCIPIVVMEPVRGGMLATLCEKSVKILKTANQEASIASWAIRYAASFPEVLTVLSGMSDMTQLQDNIQTMECFKPLDKEEYAIIEQALAVYRKTAVIPCSACRYCIGCPMGIDIPSLLAIYNNYLLGNKTKEAKKDFVFRYYTLRKDKQAHNCIKCNQCIKKCPQHIDIPYWMSVINMSHKKISHRSIFRRIASRIKQFLKKQIKKLAGEKIV